MLPLAICLVFIAYLFWVDLKRARQPSAALWAPIAWMFLAGSRWASSWLSLDVGFASATDYSEGSPVDAAVFFSLIITGVVILSRRRIDWGRLAISNIWIVIYFLFCLSSIVWTDEPFVLFKRWIKDLGNPIMALVILTDPQGYGAIVFVLRRLAFLFLPLSLLFVRYFPSLGRSYHADGSPMYTGIGHQKNDLGLMCLLAGMPILWELMEGRSSAKAPVKRDWFFIVVLGLMLVWLLRMSDSQTSFVCLVLFGLLMALGRMPFLRGNFDAIIGLLFGSTLTLWLLDETFHLQDMILGLLGRDPTLTNRTEVWAILKTYIVNPIVGAGFMSFWSGARMEEIWRSVGTNINQAHNGYFEQYLNLGYVGLALLGMVILSALMAIRRHVQEDPVTGMLRFSFIICALLYNFTEASFYGINNMWVLLLLGCLEVPRPGKRRVPSPTQLEARRRLPGQALPTRGLTRAGAKGRARAAPSSSGEQAVQRGPQGA